MSDDVVKDLEVALKLVLGKKMKEALLSSDIEEAKRCAAELQKAEDLVAANPSRQPEHGTAPQKPRRLTKKKDANGEWII